MAARSSSTLPVFGWTLVAFSPGQPCIPRSPTTLLLPFAQIPGAALERDILHMRCLYVFKVNSSSTTFCSTDLSSNTVESSPVPGETHSALQSTARQCSLANAKFPKNQKQNIEKYYDLKFKNEVK